MPIVAPLVLPEESLLPPSLFWPQAVRVRAREAAPAMAVRAALRLRMIIILDVLDRLGLALRGCSESVAREDRVEVCGIVRGCVGLCEGGLCERYEVVLK